MMKNRREEKKRGSFSEMPHPENRNSVNDRYLEDIGL
jgi:hypothetical protein